MKNIKKYSVFTESLLFPKYEDESVELMKDYQKIIKVIQSIKTVGQIKTTENLIEKFESKWDYVRMGKGLVPGLDLHNDFKARYGELIDELDRKKSELKN